MHKLEGKEIEINTTNRYTVISIKNYEAYQNCACNQSEKGTQRARQNDSLNNSYFDNYANNNSDEETEEGRQRADKGQTLILFAMLDTSVIRLTRTHSSVIASTQ